MLFKPEFSRQIRWVFETSLVKTRYFKFISGSTKENSSAERRGVVEAKAFVE